jgi:hypothetical protein
VEGKKIKTLWLLDITIQFAMTLEDQSDSLRNKWLVTLLKSNPLQSAISSCHKDYDDDYALEVKTGFIIISSLGTL